MTKTPQRLRVEMVQQARERLKAELRAQAERFDRFDQAYQELRQRQQMLEGAVEEQLAALEKLGSPAGPSLEKVLASVSNLSTATLPEQVFELLAEEAAQLGVRAAVFDIRGRGAWGAAAVGFGTSLPDKTFRSLVVPLSVESPFRTVYEASCPLDTNVEQLKSLRNVLAKLQPRPEDPILLLPIRSTGSVSAIFYADTSGLGKPLPTEALMILGEFAGAQLDRLMALGEGETSTAAKGDLAEAGLAVEELSLPPEPQAAREAEKPQPAAASRGASAGSEADQKVQRDAKRFAKLLVAEIELYNKFQVADGRKSKDLYKRLKSDIDRSRQTFEKRFGKSAGTQVDYFHEELVKTLAADDPTLLGSDYPGPSA